MIHSHDKAKKNRKRMRQRYIGLDMVKAISAFLIVCIHIPFPGIFGIYFTVLARIGVPIFFMITGFFYDIIQKNHTENKQLSKIFNLMVSANLLYFFWGILLSLFQAESVSVDLGQVFRLHNIIKLFVFNVSPFSSHLWYLSAMFYVLLMIWFLNQHGYLNQLLRCRWILYIVIAGLLITDLVFGKYSLLLLQREYPIFMVRNFMFVGLPYFTIGYLFKRIEERINKISVLTWKALLLFFSCTGLLEKFILRKLSLDAERDHFISTTFLAVAVFSLCICDAYVCRIEKKTIVSYLVTIGKDYSTGIYVLHPLLIPMVKHIFSILGMETIFLWTAPAVTFFLTILLLYIKKRAIHSFTTRLENV